MGCCWRKKRDHSKELKVQVQELAEKYALVIIKQRHLEDKNSSLRNMQRYLDDCYYALDCDVEKLYNERRKRQMWSDLQESPNALNNITNY